MGKAPSIGVRELLQNSIDACLNYYLTVGAFFRNSDFG